MKRREKLLEGDWIGRGGKPMRLADDHEMETFGEIEKNDRRIKRLDKRKKDWNRKDREYDDWN